MPRHCFKLERVFELENRRTAKSIGAAADCLRAAGRNAVPGRWTIVSDEDGTVRLLGLDDQEAAVFAGKWALSTGRDVAALDPHLSYHFAELLWLAAPMVRRNELPSPLQHAFGVLAEAILGKLGEQ